MKCNNGVNYYRIHQGLQYVTLSKKSFKYQRQKFPQSENLRYCQILSYMLNCKWMAAMSYLIERIIDMAIIIGILISTIGCEYGGFQFDTIFTYISAALQLYECCTHIVKHCKKCK